MSEHVFPYRIKSNYQAASIITAAFPDKYHKKIDPNVGAAWLADALMYARTKCSNSDLVACVKWARDYMRDGEDCRGCKHLFMRNDGGYECAINAEHVCINKYGRMMKEE